MTLARDTSHIDWKAYFFYDESSPSCLRWHNGDVAGAIRGKEGNRYWTVGVLGSHYLCHRIIWELEKWALMPTENIDHEDGNSLSNEINNLVPKIHAANCQNKKRQRDNTSGVTGVYMNIKKDRKGRDVAYWMASWIDEHGKQRSRCFRIDSLGDEVAFEQACKFREDAICTLNSLGKQYTKSHGGR